jgi:predicted ABC-type ATPase
MRVSQGGHDVPTEKLMERFPRTLVNLAAALRELPSVLIFDNDDLRTPFRQVAIYANGREIQLSKPVPSWPKSIL